MRSGIPPGREATSAPTRFANSADSDNGQCIQHAQIIAAVKEATLDILPLQKKRAFKEYFRAKYTPSVEVGALCRISRQLLPAHRGP